MPDCLADAKTSYDRRADTFYFTLTREKPQRYSEDNDGLIWRFNPQGKVVGVTVQAYFRLWHGRRFALAAKIAKPCRLDVNEVAVRLPSVSSSQLSA